MAQQRIRDPLHDLIEFAVDDELERTLWKVMQTRPFQRLRRIKQLGFSELVYSGASHTRFAHSIGVFHTARRLMDIVRRAGEREPTKEQRALAAALVHDLGHGPFSHAFEKVGERLGLVLADHETMSDRLIRDGEVADILNGMGSGFANDVADIIAKNGVKSVQHAVVSSQFDADRLDYMRRDRFMAGVQTAGIDFEWLLANIEIGSVRIGVDETPIGSMKTFVLGPKAVHAAEGYVLGLFQLYPTIYFHKATRGAEKIFTELLLRIVELVRNGNEAATGLPEKHPLIRFALDPESVETALMLDDTVVCGALAFMAEANDSLIAEFSLRLRDRDLYKCHDVRAQVAHIIDPKCMNTDELIDKIDKKCAEISRKLAEWTDAHSTNRPRILVDYAERSPYNAVTESKGPLGRINIMTDGGELVDLKERSSVVGALKAFKLSRAYVPKDDLDAAAVVKKFISEEMAA